MQPIYLAYVIVLFVVALGALVLAVYAQRYWQTAVARPFSFLMACVAWWGFFAGWSAVASSAETAEMLGVIIRFSSVVFSPLAGLLFALAYTSRTRWLHGWRLALLMVVPLGSLLMNWTSPLHELFVYDVVYQEIGGIYLRTAWSQGVWFRYVHIPYVYGSTGISVLLLAQRIRYVRYPYRQQAFLILIGATVPIIASIITTFDLLPGPDLDLIVIGSMFAGLTFIWALTRYQLLDFSPIARSMIIENMTDAMVVFDRHERVAELNPAFSKRMGISRRNAIGMSLEEIFGRFPEMVKRYQGMRSGHIIVAVPLEHGQVHLDVQVTELHDGAGQYIGRLVVWRDISRLKETEQALEAFSHMVAHDLKGPLGVIMNYSELGIQMTRLAVGTKERQISYFARILETSLKMEGIINDLLLLAKVRQEEEVPLEVVEMGGVVEEALARLLWQIEQEMARIEKPDVWPQVVGYGPWVEEVWVNYISNALKYGGERPLIELGFDALEQGSGFRFWVQDWGEGITEVEKGLLFVEFSRVGKRTIKGHGLGLSIVRRIVERMGGTVGVESEVGKGSVFWFTLDGGRLE